MSQAALLQLVATGVEDEFLTKTPEITFFETEYRQHTPFAMQTVPVLFSSGFSFGNTISCTLDRIGDMVGAMTLNVKMDKITATTEKWINDLGHTLLESVELEIGGQVVDKHYGEWLDIWAEFSQPIGKKDGYHEMVYKNVSVLTSENEKNDDDTFFDSSTTITSNEQSARDIYIPLNFWFCRNPGLALPLIALNHHKVRVIFKIAPFEKCITDKYGTKAGDNNKDTPPAKFTISTKSNDVNATARLLVNYYYLDNERRQEIATKEHKFLIEQLQTTGTISVTKETQFNRYPLEFSHPVKALFWVFQKDNNNSNQNFMYGRVKGLQTDAQALVNSVQLKVSGQELTENFSSKFFNLLQPYYHNTSVPTISTDLYSYSFALRPEEYQPTGTLNFSRIENAYLHVNFNRDSMIGTGTKYPVAFVNFRCYALNYNVFVVTSGMGGMLYK